MRIMPTSDQKVLKVLDSQKVFGFLATFRDKFEITLSTSDYEQRLRDAYPPGAVVPVFDVRSST